MSEPYWEPFAGTPSGLAYKGDYAAGTYQDGDVVVQNGVAFICVGGPTTLPPDISQWGSAGLSIVGNELAYAEITSPVSPLGTSQGAGALIVAAPTITLDGATPVLVEFFTPIVETGSAPYVLLTLWDNDTIVGDWTDFAASAGVSLDAAGYLSIRLLPSAGNHKFDVRGYSSNGGGTVYAGTGGAGYLPAFIRVTRIYPSPPQFAPAALTPVTYGTTLPASPADGQEAILVDNVANPTYQWRFRYNAGSSSAYKWEFVGGAPAVVMQPAIDSAMTQTAYATPTTPGPDFTIPRTGDYILDADGTMAASAIGTSVYWSFQFGATAAVDADCLQYAGGWQSTVFRSYRKNGLTAGMLIATKFRVGAGNGNLGSRTLQITPVRVA